MDNTDKILHIQHYLFDFDGTLVDSMPYWAASMVRVLDNHKVSHGDDIVRIITPLGLNGTANYFRTIGLELSVQEILDEMYSYLTPLYCDRILAKDGVKECLEEMRKQGFHLHVLTASPHQWLDPCLKRNDLWELFDNVWSCDDFNTGNTDPEIYVRAAGRIGVPVSDVVFLDDNINADRTAKQAGMYVVGVFDETSRDDEDAIRELADGYVRDFHELQGFLSE
ncbi:MAG: HAD family phosphatase [Lachnospiraceae bacterium]|nr:HAD family phosphatase [Lachnospiraceae bacterium]